VVFATNDIGMVVLFVFDGMLDNDWAGITKLGKLLLLDDIVTGVSSELGG